MATYSVDETEPLLSALHRTSGSLTFNSPSHTPESERAQPRALTSKFSLCLALLVDAIPGNHLSNEFLDKKTLKKIKNLVILSYSLQNSIQAVSVLIAARLGPEELSAASVALMFAFVTGESSNYFSLKLNDPTFSQLSQGGASHWVVQLRWIL